MAISQVHYLKKLSNPLYIQIQFLIVLKIE